MPRYRFDVFELDTDARRLWKSSVEIELQPRPSRVLEVLLSSPGRVWRRDELFAAAWPRMVVTDSALTQAVFELRRALGEESKRVIRTVARSGYAIDVPVERIEGGASGPTVVASGTAAGPPASMAATPRPSSPAHPRAASDAPGLLHARPAWALALAFGITLLALLMMPTGPSSRAAGPIVDRLAIMPRSGGEALPWLEMALQRVIGRELGIAAGTEAAATRPYAGASVLRLRYGVDGAPGARALSVEWALSRSGAIRRAGVERGTSGDLFAIALRIGAALGRGGGELHVGPVSEAAVEAFGAGARDRGAFRLADARRHLERALTIEPSFTYARAELAEVLGLQGYRELSAAEASRALVELEQRGGAAPSRLRADLLATAGRQMEAAQAYLALSAKPGTDPMVRFSAAFALLKGGDPDAARRLLDAVSPADLPSSAAARWHLVDEALSAQRQDNRAALAAAERALLAARAARDPWTEGRALASIAERRWRLGDADGAAVAVREAGTVLALLGESELALKVRFFELWVKSAQGMIAGGDIDALRRKALEIGNPDLEARVDMLRGAQAERGGRFEDSRDAFLAARDTYRRLGDSSNERVARFNAAVQVLALGEVHAADTELAAIRALPPIAALPNQLVDRVHASAMFELGRYEQALSVLDAAVAAATAQQAPLVRTLLCLRGRVHIARSEWERAAVDFAGCGAADGTPIDDPEDLIADSCLALLAARRGATQEARALLGRARAAAASVQGDGADEALAELAIVAARVDAESARDIVAAVLARPAFEGPSRYRSAVLAARCVATGDDASAADCSPAALGLRPGMVRLSMWLGASNGQRIADER